jgi:hypothetical protein
VKDELLLRWLLSKGADPNFGDSDTKCVQVLNEYARRIRLGGRIKGLIARLFL